MERLIIFTDCDAYPAYEALTPVVVRIGFEPSGIDAFLMDGTVELAIIDCGLDTKTGLALLEKLKQRRPEVPVIFVTDARSEEVVLRAFKLGAREYFRKPLPPEELARAVEKILRFKRDAPEPAPFPVTETSLPPLFRLPSNLPERLQRVIEYIEQNLSSPLRLDELSRSACMSKFHFCRLFKRHVGLSPMQYCICRKMELARQLLCKSDQTVTQAAFRLGFNDITEFIRQFKKFTGFTPRAFRNARCGMPPAR